MIPPIICKLTDYILLNAYSVNFAGLYNGKTGIALCLFENSRYLADEKIEDKAFELLQESLAISHKAKNAGIDFKNGLSGIGFVLLYLIENRFLDADFEELFGKQANQIQLQLKERNTFSEKELGEGNTDYILQDIDDVIFKIVNEQERIPFNLNQGLTGYLLYVISRLKGKKNRTVSSLINQGLLIKIINKLSEVVPNQFQQVGKEIHFDLLWNFPALFHVLDEALDLNIYNHKIAVMMEQWMFYLTTHLPGIHCHKLSLALSLHRINRKLKRENMDKQVRILLFSIDFDVLRKEVNPYVHNIQHGWYGIILLLYFAKGTFDSTYPNYNLFDRFRKVMLDLYKERSEREIEIYTQASGDRKRPIGKGLTNGLAGIGLLYLLCPEVTAE
jgi:hypothetical protein